MGLIELSDVCKAFQRGAETVQALRGVSFEIDSGQYVSISGPSGSGKTTLMDILGCLSRPTSGTYRLDGEDVTSHDDLALAQIRNAKIGFVFQAFHLLPRYTALENVALPLLYAGLRLAEAYPRAEEALHRVGLSPRKDHLPGQLSGGEQQRVAIARALVTHPVIILADEPTGNLDTAIGAEILGLLDMINRDGGTIVLVTHDEAAAARAQRHLSLRDGAITSST
jgi:putative ABC transport system ATP-binding protein